MSKQSLRNWQLATNYAQINQHTTENRNALRIMQDSCRFYLTKTTPPQLHTQHENRAWLAFQEAQRQGRTEKHTRVKGALFKVYPDDTLLLIDTTKEHPEIYTYHKDHGTVFVGIIIDEQVTIF